MNVRLARQENLSDVQLMIYIAYRGFSKTFYKRVTIYIHRQEISEMFDGSISIYVAYQEDSQR